MTHDAKVDHPVDPSYGLLLPSNAFQGICLCLLEGCKCSELVPCIRHTDICLRCAEQRFFAYLMCGLAGPAQIRIASEGGLRNGKVDITVDKKSGQWTSPQVSSCLPTWPGSFVGWRAPSQRHAGRHRQPLQEAGAPCGPH